MSWNAGLCSCVCALSLASGAAYDAPAYAAVAVARQAPAQRLDAAIEKAASYFTTRGLAVQEQDVIMLVFLLRRHYGYTFEFPPLEDFYRKDPTMRRHQFQIYDLFFDDRRLPPSPPEVVARELREKYPDQIDGLTDWAMFCPAHPLPADFLDVMEQKLSKGGYWVTHAALQLRNALTNGCLQRTARVDGLEREITMRLPELVGSDTVRDDIRIEALVMQFYLGAAVNSADTEWLLGRQRADGGWAPNRDADASHNHTTMLGLWALLEMRARAAGAP